MEIPEQDLEDWLRFIEKIAKLKLPNGTYHETFINVFGNFKDWGIKGNVNRTEESHLTKIYKHFEEECKEIVNAGKRKREILRKHLQTLYKRQKNDNTIYFPKTSTNSQYISTPDRTQELITLEVIGRDRDLLSSQNNLITPDEIQDLLYSEEKVVISENISIIENNSESMNIQQKIDRVLDAHANASREKLYGIENYLEQLKTYLENKHDWLISVVGSGGVGKTSVVEKLVRDYGANVGFTDVVWVTAKRRYFKVEDLSEKEIIGSSINLDALVSNIATQLQITLPTTPDFKIQFKYLQNKLKEAPYLIIIDNLETLEEYKQLIQGFNPYDLSNNLSPSKIILTSRQKLQSENSQLREVEMKGIDRQSTVGLIRYKGDHVERIAKATDEQLYPIFTVSDGIPLIILLIVNLIATNHQLTLSQIINKVLHEKNLSSYLYFEALNSISDEAYNILRTLTGFSSNSSICYEDLKKSSNLDNNDFDEAILELIRCSLLQNTSSLIDKPRYAIHSILFEFIKRSESE